MHKMLIEITILLNQGYNKKQQGFYVDDLHCDSLRYI